MQVGDKVRCRGSRGYHFTEGKEYVVQEYEPAYCTPWFTWPAYVVVIDDYGKPAHCHANRFEVVS